MGQAAGQFAPQAAASIGESVNTLVGFHAVDRAADVETQRQNEANQLYRQNYAQTQKEYAPYQQGGQSAFEALLKSYGLGQGQNGQADYSGFYNSPDYQFAMQQGGQALDRSAAARGRLYSGAQMQAQQKFGQGLATQYLSNYRNGLGNISDTGLNATNALSNYRMGYGNQLGQGITNLGDIAAAEYLGTYAVNSRHNSDMQNIHGLGGGGGNSPFQMPQQKSQQQNYLNQGGGNNYYYPTSGGGQSSYVSPSTSGPRY